MWSIWWTIGIAFYAAVAFIIAYGMGAAAGWPFWVLLIGVWVAIIERLWKSWKPKQDDQTTKEQK